MTGPSVGASVVLDRHPLDVDGAHAAVLRLNRPEQLNPIDDEVLDRIDEHLDAVESDESVRALFVTGNGRAFSAGGDLKKYVELQRDPCLLYTSPSPRDS